jgi:hypothetical protein
MKNKKYHTVRTVLKSRKTKNTTLRTVLKPEKQKIPVRTVLKSRKTKNTTQSEQFLNLEKQKIPQSEQFLNLCLSRFKNCSDCVVFFVFLDLRTVLTGIFCFSGLRTVLTVRYFLFF